MGAFINVCFYRKTTCVCARRIPDHRRQLRPRGRKGGPVRPGCAYPLNGCSGHMAGTFLSKRKQNVLRAASHGFYPEARRAGHRCRDEISPAEEEKRLVAAVSISKENEITKGKNGNTSVTRATKSELRRGSRGG